MFYDLERLQNAWVLFIRSRLDVRILDTGNDTFYRPSFRYNNCKRYGISNSHMFHICTNCYRTLLNVNIRNFDDKKDDKCWDDHYVVATNDTLWLYNWRFEEFNIHHIHSWRKLHEVINVRQILQLWSTG